MLVVGRPIIYSDVDALLLEVQEAEAIVVAAERNGDVDALSFVWPLYGIHTSIDKLTIHV